MLYRLGFLLMYIALTACNEIYVSQGREAKAGKKHTAKANSDIEADIAAEIDITGIKK